MSTTKWANSPIHEQIRNAGLDPVNRTANDTPTPETDANLAGWIYYNIHYCHDSLSDDPLPWPDFARKLERERDKAREQHQILYEQTGNTIYEARKQRDRLAEALANLVSANSQDPART